MRMVRKVSVRGEYSKVYDFKSILHFTDDGLSGTHFDADYRGFSKMMGEIERGRLLRITKRQG